MHKTLLIPALAAALLGTSPALAFSNILDVPSLWPADGAFDTAPQDTVTRNAGATGPAPTAPEPGKTRK